jgi:hypothetical protein
MSDAEETRALVQTLRIALPEAARQAEARLQAQGWNLSTASAHLWLEALADVSNAAIRQRDQAAFVAQTRCLAAAYGRASPAQQACIDVAYAQNLMWQVSAADKRWAWPLLPAPLKKLYSAIWGAPPR